MKLRCPACHAENSLEAYLSADAARGMIAAALAMPAPLARPMTEYLAMFRARNRALSFDRLAKLLGEIKPMIDAACVTRAGVDRAAPATVWQAALEQMIELRNGNKLTLPLKSNGYLLDVVSSLAEKASAAAETQREQQLRQGRREPYAEDAPSRAATERRERVGRIAADLDLGLIDAEQALALLRAAGLSDGAAQTLIEQHRRDA